MDMDFNAIVRFAADFDLLSSLLSKPELFKVFRTISPSQHGLTYPGFVEFVGRMALKGFSKDGLVQQFPDPASKLNGFMERIHGAEKWEEIKRDEWQRGYAVSVRTCHVEVQTLVFVALTALSFVSSLCGFHTCAGGQAAFRRSGGRSAAAHSAAAISG